MSSSASSSPSRCACHRSAPVAGPQANPAKNGAPRSAASGHRLVLEVTKNSGAAGGRSHSSFRALAVRQSALFDFPVTDFSPLLRPFAVGARQAAAQDDASAGAQRGGGVYESRAGVVVVVVVLALGATRTARERWWRGCVRRGARVSRLHGRAVAELQPRGRTRWLSSPFRSVSDSRTSDRRAKACRPKPKHSQKKAVSAPGGGGGTSSPSAAGGAGRPQRSDSSSQ